MAGKSQESWSMVTEDVQVKFTADGDVFTGILNNLGQNGGIPQAYFTGTGEFAGSTYFTNAGHDLMRKLEKVPLGREVRITRTGTLDTGQATPMSVYKVEHR